MLDDDEDDILEEDSSESLVEGINEGRDRLLAVSSSSNRHLLVMVFFILGKNGDNGIDV